MTDLAHIQHRHDDTEGGCVLPIPRAGASHRCDCGQGFASRVVSDGSERWVIWQRTFDLAHELEETP